jgi:hypothetical protein
VARRSSSARGPRAAGRILETLPFGFYYTPYLATIPAHYGPLAFYEKLIELYEHFTAPRMLLRRLGTTTHPVVRLAHVVRTGVKRQRLRVLRRLRDLLATDRGFRAFHEGESQVLPEHYHTAYEQLLGRFAPLVSRADRTPVLAPRAPVAVGRADASERDAPEPERVRDHRHGAETHGGAGQHG